MEISSMFKKKKPLSILICDGRETKTPRLKEISFEPRTRA
jgi:hypothetical protein